MTQTRLTLSYGFLAIFLILAGYKLAYWHFQQQGIELVKGQQQASQYLVLDEAKPSYFKEISENNFKAGIQKHFGTAENHQLEYLTLFDMQADNWRDFFNVQMNYQVTYSNSDTRTQHVRLMPFNSNKRSEIVAFMVWPNSQFIKW